MSYLNSTRFSFAGSFQAAVSTINNSSNNYRKKSTSETNKSWNPDGNGFWKIKNCVVTGAFTDQGPSAADPILQMSFNSTNSPVPGKLVDLDPQQQSVSQIWGMGLSLGSAGDTNSLAGSFLQVAFADLWARRQGSSGSPGLSAYYQTVIEDITWGDDLTSPVLMALHDASPRALSIKFNVDLYNWYNEEFNPLPPNQPAEPFPFTFGRVVGTVGPYLEGEPKHFISGRLLRSEVRQNNPTLGSPLYSGPCVVEGCKVFVDLGNSMLTLENGDIDPDQGNLRLAILNKPTRSHAFAQAMAQKSGIESEATQFIFPNNLDYTSYTDNAGIQEADFDPDLLKTIQSNPLGIVKVDDAGNYLETLLQESAHGWYVRADRFVFRMNPDGAAGPGPGNTATAHLRVTRFGCAAEGVQINLAKTAMGSGNPALQALQIPTSVQTDQNGWAAVDFSASDPGYARSLLEIDGQVYEVNYSLDVADPVEPSLEDLWNFISVQVYTDWSKIASNFDSPTWDQDVETVLNQYGVLYPFMRRPIGIDLGNFTSVTSNIKGILKYMQFERTDPRHMPVTRDLSNSKLQLIKNWRANGLPES